MAKQAPLGHNREKCSGSFPRGAGPAGDVGATITQGFQPFQLSNLAVSVANFPKTANSPYLPTYNNNIIIG